LVCIIKSLIVSDRFWYVIQNGKTYNQITKRRRGKGKNCGKYKPSLFKNYMFKNYIFNIYLKLPYLKIYFECRKESAAETYLMERSYIQVIEIDIQGAESAKRKERTALLCSAPRRPKRKGVFMCGRRDRNELFIGLR